MCIYYNIFRSYLPLPSPLPFSPNILLQIHVVVFHKPLSPISAAPKHVDVPKPAQSNKLYSIDGCGVYETSPLAEDLWATDGCWDRDIQFSPRVWPVFSVSMES